VTATAAAVTVTAAGAAAAGAVEVAATPPCCATPRARPAAAAASCCLAVILRRRQRINPNTLQSVLGIGGRQADDAEKVEPRAHTSQAARLGQDEIALGSTKHAQNIGFRIKERARRGG